MVLNAIFISLYWFSFPYVGLHVLSLFEDRWNERPISNDPMTRLFIGMCLGFATFLPIVLAGYILSAPIEPVSLLWAFIFVAFLTRFRNNAELIQIARRLMVHKYFWMMGTVLVADYGLSLYVGGYFSGDAWGHMARITDILNNGFTIFDPYFPNLIDLRASISLIHPLYASGASLVGVDATTVWLLSLAFFRFAISLSIYAVMRLITKSSLASAMTAMVSIVAFSYDWRFIQYPNKSARLWLIFITFGCVEILKNPNSRIAKIILISGSVLSTLTHPVYSAGIAGFIIITTIIHWLLSERKFSQAYIWLLMCVPALVISTVAGILIPARSTHGLGNPSELSSLFGMPIMNPGYPYSIIYVLISIGFITYIFRTNRSLALRSVSLAAVLTFPLIVFTPLFDLAREYLTPKIIFRYRSGTNFLNYNLTKVSAVVLASYLIFNKVLYGRKVVIEWLILLVAACLILINMNNVNQFISSQNRTKNNGIGQANQIKIALNNVDLSKDQILVSSLNTGYIAGSLANISVVAIPDGHAPRSYDRSTRKECLNELLHTSSRIRLNAIMTLKPDYYLLNQKTDYLLAQAQELTKISNTTRGNYALYKVDYNLLPDTFSISSPCKLIRDGNA